MKALVTSTQKNYGSIPSKTVACTSAKQVTFCFPSRVLVVGAACALVSVLIISTAPEEFLVATIASQGSAISPLCNAKIASLPSAKSAVAKEKRLDLLLAVQLRTHRFCLHNNTEFSVVFRSYNSALPSSPILVSPGHELIVSLINKLGAERTSLRSENTFRYPNTTSLHIHGIHASPVFEDNVFKRCAPGARVTYRYKIRKDHLRGTFFAHPHFHGSSTLQVGFAMAIPFIVEDSKEEIENSILSTVKDDFALTIGYYEQNTGSGRDFVHESLLSRSSTSLPVVSSNDIGPRFIWVNGVFNPSLDIQPGLTYRLRIINAAVDGVVNLHLIQSVACDFVEIAADGVYHSLGRRQELELSSNSSVIVVPGSRKDLLLTCSAEVAEVQLLSAPTEASRFLGTGTNILEGGVFRLRLMSEGQKMKKAPVHRLSLKTSLRSQADGDLRRDHLTPRSRFILRYNFPGPSTPKDRRDGDLYQFYGVNGELYTGKAVVEVRLERVYEWVIVNDYAMDGTLATESHPFHMHTNHFQIVNVSNHGLDVNSDFRIGDYRDTVSVPPGGNVTIRFRPKHFTGRSLAHCHIFTHSDTGMMVAFDIVKD